LTVIPGGHGTDGNSAGDGGGGGAGALNGGGAGGAADGFAGGAGGGGAATVLVATSGNGQIVLVAAGGGGGGGGGGGFAGENGGGGGGGGVPPGGNGADGTGSGAGTGGAGGANTNGQGESGRSAKGNTDAGGAGGGGGGVKSNPTGAFIGGGQAGTPGGTGAGGGGGGGAGSSLVDAHRAIGAPTFATAGKTGDGEVIISWSAPATTTTLTSSTGLSGVVTLTATVTPPAGVTSPQPTGTVYFHDGNRLLGQATLNASGQAVLFAGVGIQVAGPHTITADYLGDGTYAGGTSNPVSENVLGQTSVALSFSRNPAIVGQPLTLTATVTPLIPGGPVPTGQVNLCGTQITCANVTLNGKTPDQAIYQTTVKAVTPGTYQITATYRGDSVYPASFSTRVGQNLPVVAPGPLSLATTSLSPAKVGSAYSGILAASGGVNPYHWSIASGVLPSGLTLNAGSGAITGTPTAPGTTTFTAQVTDSAAPTAGSATRTLSLSVAPAALSITTTSLAQGRVGTIYSATLTATGGTTPDHWSIASGSLPTGLSLNASTGAITGTPTAPGTSSFTVKVLDSTTPTALSATQALTLTVVPTVQPAVYVANGGNSTVNGFALTSTGDSAPLASIAGSNTGLSGTAAVAIDATGRLYVASAGNDRIAEFANAATANTMPAATISGSHTGLNDPQAVALDAAGDLYVANQAATTITIYAPGAGGDATPLRTISGPDTGLSSPDALTVDTAGNLWVANYANNSLTEYASAANGDAAPLRTISGPDTGLNAPQGLTLDSAGNLLAANTFAESLTEYPTSATGDATPLRTISGAATGLNFPIGVDVDAQGDIYVSNQFGNSIIVFAPNASGNAAPLRTIAGAATGLSSPGRLAVDPPLSVLTRKLHAGSRGRAYHARVEAALGTSPYRWKIIRGHLPAGLRLRPSTGEISGTPRRLGTFRFLIMVTDSTRQRMTATKWLTITVRPAHAHSKRHATPRPNQHRNARLPGRNS
jgi:sugar lactone lactonase YvrE